jgi:NTE family protein
MFLTPSSQDVAQNVAFAIQGGGAHGAFAWGVLDRLLEEGQLPQRVCGVSSGALCAVALVQGLVQDGADGARAALRQLWDRICSPHTGAKLTPLERWLFGWDLSGNLAWRGMETATRLFSPAQLNPLGHNPLRGIVEDLLDRRALTEAGAPRLTISATDVETGRPALFDNAAITVDALLASSCLPFVFPTVEINGRAYWDGGYSGNPPLFPLLRPKPPGELILIRVQPRHRPGIPHDMPEIFNRLNEIAFQSTLETELAALPTTVRLRTYAEDVAMANLPISSKMMPEREVVDALFRAGRSAVPRGPVEEAQV